VRLNSELVRSNFQRFWIQSFLGTLIGRFEARECIHEPGMVVLQLLRLNKHENDSCKFTNSDSHKGTNIIESVPSSVGDLRTERNSQALWGAPWRSPTTKKHRRNWYRPLLEERTAKKKKRKLNPNTARTQQWKGLV